MTGTPHSGSADKDAGKRGEELFHKIGCVACHAPRTEGAAAVSNPVPLGDLSAKYTNASLLEFLSDPLKVRPSGRMPALNLKAEEARDLAAYFVPFGSATKEYQQKVNLKFTVYAESFQKIPDFGKLTPAATGNAAGFDVSASQKTGEFGMRFEGFIHIPRDGEYRFYTGSDDGSRLLIDGQLVVNNDGIHSMSWADGHATLKTGPHAIVVEFIQGGGQAELEVEFDGPGIERQPVSNYISLERDKPTAASQAAPQGFVFDVAQAEKGRALFAKLGCASCHQLKQGQQNIASTLQARPLAEAQGRSRLSERGAVRRPSALRAQRPPARNAHRGAGGGGQARCPRGCAKNSIHRTLAAFNCVACHVRDGLGGVEEARNDYFLSTQKEMGDEGRLPPSLNGVGDKLQFEYLRHIFNNGGEDRPYMITRMPKFGQQNLDSLAQQLQKEDLKKSDQPPVRIVGQVSRIKSDARQLVGEKGLACIKCHDFGNHSSTGVRAINLLKMTQRLRPDWFERYLLDPQAYRPGTRMPAPWPNGQTFFKKVLDGDSRKQITAIWFYLADGGRAAVPAGLTASAMQIVAEKEPVIYRNFIEGAGPRAIGVGYPEHANLAFDAENLRLALIWHGAFIDASRHWTGRGEGYQPPAGDHVVALSKLSPLAVLPDPQATWPVTPAREQGYQFEGYRLSKERRPTFLYRFQNVEVEDTPVPVAASSSQGEPSLKRTLAFKAPAAVGNLWLLVGAAPKIEPAADGWYQVDGEWKLRAASSDPEAKPVLRSSGNQTELLFPVKAGPNRVTITEEFEW